MPAGDGQLLAALAAANLMMRATAQESLLLWEQNGQHPNPTLARQVLWHYGLHLSGIQPAGFFAALIGACAKANPENRLRLSLAFPVLVWTVCAVELLPDGADRLLGLLERKAVT